MHFLQCSPVRHASDLSITDSRETHSMPRAYVEITSTGKYWVAGKSYERSAADDLIHSGHII
jgi:hypothetical protein